MRTITAILLVCVAVVAEAQPSYWFSQFQKQGNAQLAQEYFFRAGNGITITYTNPGPYVWINATGTNITVATNAISSIYAQFATNWLGSNALYLLLSGQITNYTPGSNVTFTLTSPHSYRIDSSGGGSGTNFYYTNTIYITNLTVGMTTNFNVVFANGSTNMINFTNGLLMAINSAAPSHGPSLILPGGGYLIQPSGGTLLLP